MLSSLAIAAICSLSATGVAQQPVVKPPAAAPVTAKPVTEKPAAKTKTAAPVAKPVEAGAAEAKPTEGQQEPAPPPLPKRTLTKFTTGDGSRFVLIHDPSMQLVHWVIASWADGSDDPPGLTGLTLATAQASLNGTWTTGSLDATAEQQALIELDAAWQKKMANPGKANFEAELVRLDKAAKKLGDPRTFQRVLAAAPTFRPEVTYRDPIAIMALTTIEPAIAHVAKLLVERREDQALRSLMRVWLPNVLQRLQAHAAQPRRRLHAELLALVHPFSSGIQRLEPPPLLAPTREQAMAAWQSSQHPTRTVHVLFGSLNAPQTKATLAAAFATTSLPAPSPRRVAPLRPITSQRRSVVPGIPGTGVVVGWVLPAQIDPWALEVGVRWLARPDGSLLGQLRRTRPKISITCRAPWPRTSNGQGLLLLDIIDPSGKPGLGPEVVQICQKIANDKLRGNPYHYSYMSLLHDWNKAANDSRSVAITMAERALMWPKTNLNRQSPPWVKPASIAAALRSVFASQPAIVEGRR